MLSKREREDELADFGEVRACELLRKEGFVVERMPKNFPFLISWRRAVRAVYLFL
jgi:hypothetical protein